jgi:predicted enzyme related to lactoylglutathione lyase
MKKIATWVIGGTAALLFVAAAQAGVSFNAGRVGAVDVPALAKFYESAFGLKEVNRLEFPGMVEIMMNFGDSVDAAKKNPSAQIVLMHRDAKAVADSMPHLIFNVTDITATVAAIKAAGGKMESEPKEFGKTGIIIGMVVDPAGNHVELIQQPKR